MYSAYTLYATDLANRPSVLK